MTNDLTLSRRAVACPGCLPLAYLATLRALLEPCGVVAAVAVVVWVGWLAGRGL
jgi:N-acetyl-gamma-glutamylphosphate reductase